MDPANKKFHPKDSEKGQCHSSWWAVAVQQCFAKCRNTETPWLRGPSQLLEMKPGFLTHVQSSSQELLLAASCPKPPSRTPTSSPSPPSAHCSFSAAGAIDTSFSSSVPIPVVMVSRQRPHPNHSGRNVLVDGRNNYACVLGIVQAAAGIF